MAVKFKVAFTMSAETLFGIIAKFLPIEDLHVEEIEPTRTPLRVEKVARLGGPDNRLKEGSVRGNRHRGPDLDAGVNGVIMRHLSDGKPHKASEMARLLKAAGYAESGTGSRLQKLRNTGYVHQPEIGLWQIGAAKKKSA